MALRWIHQAGRHRRWGAIGRRLIPLLVQVGYQVTGMTRSESKVDLIRRLGAESTAAYDSDDVSVPATRCQRLSPTGRSQSAGKGAAFAPCGGANRAASERLMGLLAALFRQQR